MTQEKNPLITHEGIEIEIGQIWASLDPREQKSSRGPRRCKVVGYDLTGKAPVAFMKNLALPKLKATRVSIARMCKGSTGWKLESSAPKPESDGVDIDAMHNRHRP